MAEGGRPAALGPLRRGTRVLGFALSVVVVLALPRRLADLGTLTAWAITLLVLAAIWAVRHLVVRWAEIRRADR